MRALIRLAFNQFYTTFAWTYDAVAALVSFGEWKQWGQCVIPFISRRSRARVLEIAHGPGHLHVELNRRGFNVFGFDLSPQMLRLTRQRFLRANRSAKHARATAMRLPFASGAFDCAVATFPAAFIFAPNTLAEVHRVLSPNGVLLIVPSTRLRRSGPLAALVDLAYRITGQRGFDLATMRAHFAAHQFHLTQHTVQTQYAEVLVWELSKEADTQHWDSCKEPKR
jgi:ubiquinone/menaquinone biosynthesis C-methylase UbiE